MILNIVDINPNTHFFLIHRHLLIADLADNLLEVSTNIGFPQVKEGASLSSILIFYPRSSPLLSSWLDQVVLPPLLARIAYLTSQATLFIFLFHYYFFLAIVTIRAHFGWPFWLESSPAQLVIGLAGPVFLWLLWNDTVRVYRRRCRISGNTRYMVLRENAALRLFR